MEHTILNQFILECIDGFSSIEIDRKKKLNALGSYLQSNIQKDKLALIFICTHNSRRSFFAQVWAQVAAHHYGFSNITAYSGGTSETAIYHQTIAALMKCGLEINKLSLGDNPVYSVKYDTENHPIIGFSKTFDHSFNPQSNFAAIMTCDHADQNCPFIPEADARIPLTYTDPKEFDHTAEVDSKYYHKSKEIATEMFFILNQINK